MFSDLLEALRNRWRSTGKPALQSLLADRRGLVSSFAVLLLLESLLCILLLAYACGQAAEQRMLAEIALFGAQTGGDGDWLTQAAAALAERGERMAGTNRATLALALMVWGGSFCFIVSRLIFSSVELKKFIYGLYITFGANTRKIRSLVFWQMMAVGLAALVPSVPLALLVCHALYGYLPGGGQLARAVLLALALPALLLAVVTAIAARRTTARTCVLLLSAADVSDYVRSPRRSRRVVPLNSPRRLGGLAVWRMRGYSASLVLSAVLPACIFFCCLSLVRSDRLRMSEPIEEYTLHYANGFASAQYRGQLASSLADIPGVAGTAIGFTDSAATAGLHILLQGEQLRTPETRVACYGGSAYDDVMLLSADEYSLWAKCMYPMAEDEVPVEKEPVSFIPDSIPWEELPRFGIYPPDEGEALMVYPTTLFDMPALIPYSARYVPDSTVFIPIYDAEQTERTPEERAADTTRTGISFTVAQQTVNDYYLIDKWTATAVFMGHRLDSEYLVLHPEDFKRVTGIDAAANAALGIATPPVRLSRVGGYVCGGASPEADSVTRPPMYAKNDFDVTVSDETARTRYGLPADAVLPAAPGEVTLLLRPDSDIVPEPGQIQLSGVTAPDDPGIAVPDSVILSDTDLLKKALAEHPQYYRAYRVCDVIISSHVEADTLLMQEDDLTALFGRSGAYTDLRVSVTPDIDVGSVCSLLTSLYGWVAVHPLNGSAPTLTQSGELWDALIITGFRYDQLLTAIAVLLLLAAPFIWFCQQYSHYRKRKSDLETLLLLGQTRAGLRRVFLWEGLLLALLAALAALVICPLLTLAAYGLLAFNGFPFAYSAFDYVALAVAALFSALCALGSALLNHRILFPPARRKKGQPSAGGPGAEAPEANAE